MLSLFTSFLPAVSRAEDAPPKPEKPWKDSGEISVVSTNGNSKNTTTSVKNTFTYKWSKAALEFIAGGLGAQTNGSVTAEQYNASEKVTFPIGGSDKNYLFEKLAWDSNRFAGYYHHYDAMAGYGRQLLDLAKDKLVGELGGGYVNEERVAAPRDEFGSGRVYTKYTRILSETSQFTQDAEYLHNFEDSKNYRLNTETAITASITTQLALKAYYKWKRVGKPPVGIARDDTTTGVALVINY
jgi:putative salt-induced outer membrane protein